MFTFSLGEAFLTLFIGMGPIKVLLIYISKTQGIDKSIKRKMARRIAFVAAGVAIALFIIGAIIQQLLHFSIGALNIIGEAAKHLPQSLRDRYPDIPWREVTGMRDKLSHDYFGVDLLRVLETVRRDLPPLCQVVEQMLTDLSGEDPPI